MRFKVHKYNGSWIVRCDEEFVCNCLGGKEGEKWARVIAKCMTDRAISKALGSTMEPGVPVRFGGRGEGKGDDAPEPT